MFKIKARIINPLIKKDDYFVHMNSHLIKNRFVFSENLILDYMKLVTHVPIYAQYNFFDNNPCTFDIKCKIGHINPNSYKPYNGICKDYNCEIMIYSDKLYKLKQYHPFDILLVPSFDRTIIMGGLLCSYTEVTYMNLLYDDLNYNYAKISLKSKECFTIKDINTNSAINENNTTKKSDYISWDEYFMGVAQLSSLRSKDPSTQVGACIVRDNKILSVGYNGFPKGISDDKFPWVSEADKLEDCKDAYTTHAELNAILNSNFDLKDSTLYVTRFPCNECAKAIIQCEIRKIYYLVKKDNEKEQIATKLFEEVGINTEQLDFKFDINIIKRRN